MESSKTDELRDGAWVVISHTDSHLICPVAMLERYLSMAIATDHDTYPFIAIVTTKNGQKLRESGSVSYIGDEKTHCYRP